MCQYSSSCVVLQNAMRTQQRQQHHHHQQQQQPQQVGAGSQNQQVRQVHQQQATKMNGHSNVLQTSNSENVPRRQTCQGHGKMAKGRRATAHQLGQNLSKLAKSDPMANGDVGRVVTGFGRCRSGSGSAGSSPTKQFHAGPPQTYQQQPTGSGRIGSGSPRPVAGQNSSSSIRSRSYTPPSRDRLLHGSSTAAGGRAMSPSPSLTYAGARFSEPPSPKVLPRPPTHWFASADQAGQGLSSCTEMTNALKGMLKVQC